jgi:hypothetical protein
MIARQESTAPIPRRDSNAMTLRPRTFQLLNQHACAALSAGTSNLQEEM